MKTGALPIELLTQQDVRALKTLMSQLHVEHPCTQNPHPNKVFCVENSNLPDPKELQRYVSSMRTWTTSVPLLQPITTKASTSSMCVSSPDLVTVDGDVVHRRVLEYAYVRSKWVEAGHRSTLEDLEAGAGHQSNVPEWVQRKADCIAYQLEEARRVLQESETSLSSSRAVLLGAQDTYRESYDHMVCAAATPETCVEAYPRLTHAYNQAREALPASSKAFIKCHASERAARDAVRKLEIEDAVVRSMVPYADEARAYGTSVVHRQRARHRRAVEIGEGLLSAACMSSSSPSAAWDETKADTAIAAMVESMRRRCVKGSEDVRRVLREGHGVKTIKVNGVERPV